MDGLPSAEYYEVRRALEEIVGWDIHLFNQGDGKEFAERVKRNGNMVFERGGMYTF